MQDWAGVELPDTWPDGLNLANPVNWIRLYWRARKRKIHRVELPENLRGGDQIPAYVLLEFHGLPNGNYSNSVARGYARSLDSIMLGTLARARNRVAQAIGPVDRALDLGCGAGAMPRALQAAGVRHVIGIDPSPYLLRFAAESSPGVQLQQGIAEKLDIADNSQDAVTACFVLHEMPPARVREAFAEVFRVLKPGGMLAVIEPSRHQWEWPWVRLFARYGWRGVYFRLLAGTVNEPFLAAWHRLDLEIELAAAGLKFESESEGCPLRLVTARKSPEGSLPG